MQNDEEDEGSLPDWMRAAEEKLSGQETLEEMSDLYAAHHNAYLLDPAKAHQRVSNAIKEERRAFEVAVAALEHAVLTKRSRVIYEIQLETALNGRLAGIEAHRRRQALLHGLSARLGSCQEYARRATTVPRFVGWFFNH